IFNSYAELEIPFSATGFKNTQIVLVPLSGVPNVNNPMTGKPVTSADIYQTLLAQGVIGHRTIAYDDLTQFGIGPGFRFPPTGHLSPDYVNPYAEQASFEVERSIAGAAVSVGYNFSRSLHLPRSRDVNLYLAGRHPDGSPIYGYVNPALVNDFAIESAANSYY